MTVESLSAGRSLLSTFDKPVLTSLTGLCLASLFPFRNFPDYESILISSGKEPLCPETSELLDSGHWFLKFYMESVEKSDLSLLPSGDLVEAYLSSAAYTSLSDDVSRALYQFILQFRTLIQGESMDNEAVTASVKKESESVTFLAGQFNLALKEVLMRIHLGSILIGELKWQSNSSLFRDLSRNERDSGLLDHITSFSAEAQLKNRLLDLSESISDYDSAADNSSDCNSLEGVNLFLTKLQRALLRTEVISFFCDRIVTNTKKGQCGFIRLRASTLFIGHRT